MVSVIATLVGLVAIGLLFVLDPGGAIAESGFPDYREMDWTQLTAWGFRLIGVGVGLLLSLLLWRKYRSWKSHQVSELIGAGNPAAERTVGGGCIGAGRPDGQ